MFKSCDYCRHRKKKCVLPDPRAARCTDCQRLDIPCEFSQRTSSLKRQKTSQIIAASLSNSAKLTSRWPPRSTLATPTPFADGNTQRQAGDRVGSKGKIIVLGEEVAEGEHLVPMAKLYASHVQPFAPFLPVHMLSSDVENDTTLRYCIQIASYFSLNNRRALPVPGQIEEHVNTMLGLDEPSPAAMAGTTLLLLRVDLTTSTLDRIFSSVERAMAVGSMSGPALAGALNAHSWLTATGYQYRSLRISPEVLSTQMRGMDNSSFTYHYLRMSQFMVDFNDLRSSWDSQLFSHDVKVAWLRLEYDCLRWPIQLPASLLDLRDEMPATPEALVLHALQNVMFLSFYAFVFDNQETLGNAISLRPVPGVMHFLCSLARSSFLCPQDIIDRWQWIAHAQAAVVRAMLRLWRVSQFENCKAILDLWDDQGKFPDVVTNMRDEIGHGPWDAEISDGYTVYWTFRDLRSMALEFSLGSHGF